MTEQERFINWYATKQAVPAERIRKVLSVPGLLGAPREAWQAAIPKWISVDERLPAKVGFYLVFTDKGKTAECHYCCDEFVISYVDWQKVTHWMPLPQPPQVQP